MIEQQSSSRTTRNNFILTGNNTYVPWLKNFENKSFVMEWFQEIENEDGTSNVLYPDEHGETLSATQQKEMKKKIIDCKSFILETIDPQNIEVNLKNGIRKILLDLARTYGAINIDASHFKIKLPGKMYFDPLKNPTSTFRWLNNQQSTLKSAGNPLSNKEYQICVEIGLEPPSTSSSSHNYFWFAIYSKIKESVLPLDPDYLEEMVTQFWRTYQSDAIVNAEMLNTNAIEPILPTNNRFSANSANATGPSSQTPATSKFCKHCSENGRQKYMKNHNFSNCSFKDYKESGFPKRYSKR